MLQESRTWYIGICASCTAASCSNYIFTGQAVALPICLGNLPHCIPLTSIWKSALLWNGTNFFIKRIEFFGFNATELYNAIHWPDIPCSSDKHNPWIPHKQDLWKQCTVASPIAINVTGYKLAYCSYNDTSENNVTRYWTTPLM
jgi:hypothetical protein